MPLRPGSRLGPYEVTASIGAGGMGEVYRARDTKLRRDVAIKVLPPSMAQNADRMARFQREAEVLASLNHPNIAQIYGMEEADGVPALVMELVEGRTLDQTIPAGGASPAQFFDIATALAEGLHAAFQKRITHRDLKPANIMVTIDGRVKILDFGLARVAEDEGLDDATTRMALTQMGTVIGTVPYMSPEQVAGCALDHRSDLFSLGVVLYELVTGGRPFRGNSAPSLIASILREHPAPVVQIRPDMPAEISNLIGRCLEKDPANRIQTAQEILLELKVQRRLYESGPRAAVPVSTPSGGRGADMKVAVMPLICRSSNQEVEDLAEGLTDEITAGLLRFPYLTVVSRSDASNAGARYRLEGNLRASGNSVRVSMRLVDSLSESVLWAETYDRQLTAANLFDVQDDVTSRVVATVADQNGVRVRFMAMSLNDRPYDSLTVAELMLRFFVYIQNFRVEERVQLRAGFEAALRREPLHANGWACLAGLYGHEYQLSANPPADLLRRMRQLAEHAIEIDPLCQQGWCQRMLAHAYGRDLAALRIAAERTIELNPLNSHCVAISGIMLANAGDWDRGIEVVRQAMAPNPNHAGWYHHVIFVDHYRRREYQEALTALKRINMPAWPRGALARVAVSGQLGRSEDARSAWADLAKIDPALLDPVAARRVWSVWHWDEELADRFVEGLLKAKALVQGADVPA